MRLILNISDKTIERYKNNHKYEPDAIIAEKVAEVLDCDWEYDDHSTNLINFRDE